MAITPAQTHPSAFKLFFTLFAALMRVLRDVSNTNRLFAAMRKAVGLEASHRAHVEALERTIVVAKADLASSKVVAKAAMSDALAADRSIADRVTVFVGKAE